MTFALFEGLARFVVRFRVLVAVFWLVVMAVALLALPSLGSEANSDPSLFLSSSAPSVKAADVGTPLLGSTSKSKITIVAARADGPLTQADLAAIAREARLADQVKGVASVKHPRGLAAAGNGSISPDSRALQFSVDVDSSSKDVTALKIVVNALHATFAKAGAPPGLQLHLAGQVASNAANNASGNKATGKIGLYSILFIIVLLLIVLRSPVAALATFVPSLVALLVSERFIAGLGADGLQISSITQTLLVVLILGAGTDYGLFLVYRFREELRAGAEPREAVVHALTRVGESISASAGTVILALLTLLLAGFGLYRRHGRAAGARRGGDAAGRADPAARTAGHVRWRGVPRSRAERPRPRDLPGRRPVGEGDRARCAPPGPGPRLRGADLRRAGPGCARIPDSQPGPLDHSARWIGRSRGQCDPLRVLPADGGQPRAPGPELRRAGVAAPGLAGCRGGQPAVIGAVRRPGWPAERGRHGTEPRHLRRCSF